MTKSVKQRLCGGTFFTLFLRARKPLLGANKYYDGKLEPYSEPIALLELSRVIVPDWKNIFVYAKSTCSGNTSEYKICKNDGGNIFPFGDSTALSAFDRRVKENYISALSEMCRVTDLLIDTGSAERDITLVKELLALINIDDSIESTQPFYIAANGSPITKASLLQMESICLQAFLLGVWHFAVMRREKNAFGKETIDLWCPSSGGGKREYNGNLKDICPIQFKLSYFRPVIESCEGGILENATGDENTTVDPDVEPEQDTKKEPAVPNVTQQVLNTNPTFNTFNFNAPIHSFNNHVDKIVNNYRGKDDE